MNKLIPSKLILGCLCLMASLSMHGQENGVPNSERATRLESDKRNDDYLKLMRLGYSEREIYEDLGNVNFLTEDFRTAAFWYQKLIDLGGAGQVPASYKERYQYALHKAGIINNSEVVARRDWISKIREDYQIDRSFHAVELTRSLAENYHMPDFGRTGHSGDTEGLDALRALSEADLVQMQAERNAVQNAYVPAVAVTADGRTAYFSKPVMIQPLYGLFSKKQLVHKIYKAEKVNGEWSRIQEVAVAPKHASALHPAISADGRRLYFASDMPGTFGRFDLYVADIKADGTAGVARNLGEKINTRKNDLYPSLVGSDILFFASDGRAGFGGLDLFAARVAGRSVGLAINIGSPFNSGGDEFALNLETDKGIAYVMSNREAPRHAIQELVFSYYESGTNPLAENRYGFMEILTVQPEASLANTSFED